MAVEALVRKGNVTRDGVRIAIEVYGSEGPVLLLLPCWIIVHARQWKAQIADLSKDCRLVVIEGRGNGASDRPEGPQAYTHRAYADDAIAVMNHLDLNEVTLVGFSMGGAIAALIAEQRAENIKALILIAPVPPLAQEASLIRQKQFLTAPSGNQGWMKYNAHNIEADFTGFVEFFFDRMFCEPHSSKQHEDAVSWAHETSAQCLIDSTLGSLQQDGTLEYAYQTIRKPVLVIHGDADEIVPYAAGKRIAAMCNATLLTMPGSGHGPHLRHPAKVNANIRQFLTAHGLLQSPAARPLRTSKTPRVLYLSSPIGLGHARRDLAIARAMRLLRPELDIEWLAQDPVTRMLSDSGETVVKASNTLANESRHIESLAGEHDLNVFEALRRMDEILVRNFRTFQDLVESRHYDLVVADEGWEIDHFWHEHPELKRSALVWMTDFVGFAEMPEAGARERLLTTDYNSEMVRHVEDNPQVRDRAIFVGNPADIVDDQLGPDMPRRQDWVRSHFDFSGYVLGDGVPSEGDRQELREKFGFRPDEKIGVVTVGGSGVGAPLIRRIIAAMPLAQQRHPELRFIVVTGPRLAPEQFPSLPHVSYRGFEPDLPGLLAACDIALVQGGLSTCMELTAVRTPFLYFPLQHHFEQNVHVRKRLDAYGAGHCMPYATSGPEEIASAMSRVLANSAPHAEVERDGAARAARLIAGLL